MIAATAIIAMLLYALLRLWVWNDLFVSAWIKLTLLLLFCIAAVCSITVFIILALRWLP